MALLEISGLKVYFKSHDSAALLRAVDGVSFSIEQGESLGLVGESGCGKTTVGNAIIGMAPITAGSVSFAGMEPSKLRGAELKRFRQRVQMVFQDPFGSLNPRMTIGAVIKEVLRTHKLAGDRHGREKRMIELMAAVELEAEYADRYPHEFSGGQRQRIGIARALATSPLMVIADEPVSALDVSVQVQILNLMRDLQKKFELSYLFIAHDLAVVRYMCKRICVMYLGRIVETGEAEELFEKPAHPYTEALLSAVPDIERGLRSRATGRRRIVLKGDVPSPTSVIPGCPFHPRCQRATELCARQAPPSVSLGRNRTSVCHFAQKLAGIET